MYVLNRGILMWLLELGSKSERWGTCALFGFMNDDKGNEGAVVGVDVMQEGCDSRRFATIQLLLKDDKGTEKKVMIRCGCCQ